MIDIKKKPTAYAVVKGNKNYPDIEGKVDFYEAYGGTVVVAFVRGLPKGAEGGGLGFHGFHMQAVHVQKMGRESFLLREDIITRRIPHIRLMPEICRRC